MRGRRIRRRTVSAANIKLFHVQPEHVRHSSEDEFEHLAWVADLGLAGTLTAVVPLYTLTERQVVGSTWNGCQWKVSRAITK